MDDEDVKRDIEDATTEDDDMVEDTAPQDDINDDFGRELVNTDEELDTYTGSDTDIESATAARDDERVDDPDWDDDVDEVDPDEDEDE